MEFKTNKAEFVHFNKRLTFESLQGNFDEVKSRLIKETERIRVSVFYLNVLF